jgi:hypothetical protein
MPVEIVWYGERGIINSLVLALKNAGIEAVKELLRTVKWANDASPDWIARVADAKLIVEIGASQFGDPDLIIVCGAGDQQPYAVFLEAKVAGYVDSAMSIADGIRKNFNSSINGQLSLKYRLAHALRHWQGGLRTVCELKQVAEAYQQAPSDGGLGDPQPTPRRLAKPEVLRILDESGLAGLDFDRCYFVALTRDRQTIFSPAFGTSEFRPFFLDEAGRETWGDPEMLARIGWLGYSAIGESARMCQFLGADYHQAVNTMMRPAIAEVLRLDQAREFQWIRTYAIEEHSTGHTRATLDAIEVLAKERFGSRSVKRETGSMSIRPFDRVLIKVVPRYRGSDEERLLLGTAESLGLQNLGGKPFDEFYRMGAGPNAQNFCMTELPQQMDEALETADGIFELLAEMLELDREHPEI